MSSDADRKMDQVTGKESHRSSGRLEWDIRAADALELARLMPPGPERNQALEHAVFIRKHTLSF